MSCSVTASSAVFFLTPAAFSCSSSDATGIFSFSANWATFDFAIDPFLGLSGLRAGFPEPGLARFHDELVGAFDIHAGHLGELVRREIRQRVPRGDALGRE